MFNESANVERTLERLTAVLKPLAISYELIFVNDGSTDNTLAVCEKFKAQYPELKLVTYTKNQGRGYALKKGFAAAEGDYVIAVDFDLSYDASHVPRIFSTFEADPAIDIVLISAYMPGGATEGVPAFRLLVSKLGNKVLSFAFPQKIYTSTCVVRGYKRNIIQGMLIDASDKEIHLEILSRAFALNCKIVEIPGTLRRRLAGKSKFKLKKTSQSHLLFLFLERPAQWIGKCSFYFFLLFILAAGFLGATRLGFINTHSLIAQIISPAVVLTLLCFAIFLGITSIVATLVAGIRREMIKTQALLSAIKRGQSS